MLYSVRELRWKCWIKSSVPIVGIDTLDGANAFLHETYVAGFNENFAVVAKEKGTAFRNTYRADLNWIFRMQSERGVVNYNTVNGSLVESSVHW